MTSTTAREDRFDPLPWLRLRLVEGMHVGRYCRLIERFGSPDAALGAGAGRVEQALRCDADFARAVAAGADDAIVERELEAIEREGARLLTQDHPDFPDPLRTIPSPPRLLYARGEFEDSDRFAIAVVGTRRCSHYGRLACERICARLAEVGLTLVSGLARGVDAIATAVALKGDGRVHAVLGNGLSICFPAENKGLLERVTQNGVALSEYPMATKGHAYHFPERNRLIAGLALGTLVVEAPEKSGALITAAHALEANREVFAVPGDVTRAASLGCNRLIQQGARLTIDADDILSELGDQLAEFLVDHKRDQTEKAAAGLEGVEAAIYAWIAREPIQIDELLLRLTTGDDPDPDDSPDEGETIAARPDLDIRQLSSHLFNLEMKNLVRQLPGQVYAAADARGG